MTLVCRNRDLTHQECDNYMRVNNQPDMGECGRVNATRVRFWLSLVSPMVGLGELGMVFPWVCNIATTESNIDFHIVGIVLTHV